jgi:hypothetical protein
MPLTKKKCFSKCRKKSEKDCGPKICKYIKGKKYQYCRLGYKYKMDENCNITRRKRKTKITKKQARLNINAFLNKTKKNKNQNPQTPNTNLAANKIQKFMKKNKMKIKSRFLQSICSDSGVCLAFGNKSNEIKEFFDNFIGFKYANDTVKRLGAPSENGFVNEVSYEREKYKAHSIIKSSAHPNADNLFYEYLCGLVVNNWCLRFPSFLETYGLYNYLDNYEWKKVKNNQTTSINALKEYIVLLKDKSINIDSSNFNILLENSCQYSNYIAIMIQHIKNAKTLYDFFKDSINKNLFVNNQLVSILFQVYFALHVLKNNFTHYDLHNENVLIYQPNQNGYIHYHYVLSNGDTISFKSPYMAKIIDYGRSYFKHESKDDFNSKNIYDKICKEKECNPCGEKVGYGWLTKSGALRNQFYIHSTVPNKSHDLRLLYSFKSVFKYYKLHTKTHKKPNSLYFNILNKLKYNTTFGTPEAKNNGYPGKIQTVSDAFRGLSDLIAHPDFFEYNEAETGNLDKLGDLYIYENNRPMKFKN